MPEPAYVALGSNLGDRWGQLSAALTDLTQLAGVAVDRASSVYETDPVGYVDQPAFLNAVVRLHADLEPPALLDALQEIESRHHRQRLVHWGPRTLDLDLLLYGGRQLDTAELVVPHPRMTERAFVLVPLCEIAPDLRHPVTGQRLAAALLGLPGLEGVRCLGPFPVAGQ
jgi:2-amino-4-hydroxy-6-hydroxymethyldihydropteridine diphosphokinase